LPSLAVVFIVALFLPATLVFAVEGNADTPKQEGSRSGEAQKDRERSWLDVIIGEPGKNNLYFGMWSYHFLKGNDEYETDNNLIGISYGGYFFGSFINSYDDRAWSVGVQRDVYEDRWRWLNLEAGYRAGLLYGYDAITIPNTKLGPLFQVYTDVRYRRFGLQFTWAWEVVTAGFFIRLP
jgi:hypothetical protein